VTLPEQTQLDGSALLHTSVERVLRDYPAAARQPLAGHPLAMFMREDLAAGLARLVGRPYQVQGSPGLGNWAETPWVAAFEPSITTTAQRGFYVVYLIAGDGSGLYLSLNQGTTEVLTAVGGRRYLEVLEGRAAGDAALLGADAIAGMHTGRLTLPGRQPLTRGYNSGNIAARHYPRNHLPSPARMLQDLRQIVGLYEALIECRELVNEATGEELPADVKPGEEAQKFRWHRRAERNRRLAQDAKRYHGLTCQVCGFNFADVYGQHGDGYIEAHHLVPFSQLAARPGAVVLDPRTDFTVVCANCHRMLHRSPGLALEALRSLLVETQ